MRRSIFIDAGFVFVLALPFLVLFIRPPLTNFWPVMVAWLSIGLASCLLGNTAECLETGRRQAFGQKFAAGIFYGVQLQKVGGILLHRLYII